MRTSKYLMAMICDAGQSWIIKPRDLGLIYQLDCIFEALYIIWYFAVNFSMVLRQIYNRRELFGTKGIPSYFRMQTFGRKGFWKIKDCLKNRRNKKHGFSAKWLFIYILPSECGTNIPDLHAEGLIQTFCVVPSNILAIFRTIPENNFAQFIVY